MGPISKIAKRAKSRHPNGQPVYYVQKRLNMDKPCVYTVYAEALGNVHTDLSYGFEPCTVKKNTDLSYGFEPCTVKKNI